MDNGTSTSYYIFNAHGDVTALTNGAQTVTKSYDYDAFGNEKEPSATDTNPFRYCGEYFDKETGTYYLRARYYDPAIGRFTQQDTHWNTANMIYGDNPNKINEREDALGLKTYTYVPKISAIVQSGNLYVYCLNNPIRYRDVSGKNADAIYYGWSGFLGAATIITSSNFWNPVGWVVLAVLGAVVVGGTIYYGIQYTNEKSLAEAKSFLEFASTAATPPPPNDPHSKGTQTTSKTLYNKKGTRIDVENPGNRPGQIHVQQGGEKYIYDIENQVFRTMKGELAPKAIQKLLDSPEIIKAIAKGLKYLGY